MAARKEDLELFGLGNVLLDKGQRDRRADSCTATDAGHRSTPERNIAARAESS
jgi:hypothetical protein